MNVTNVIKYVSIAAASFIVSFLLIISIPRNSILVDDQPKGQAIHIKRLELSKGGFVVVRALDKISNLPDEFKVLNNPIYLPAGIYQNFNVLLNDDALIEERAVNLSLYEDRGNPGLFEVYPEDPEHTDVALKTWDGKLAQKTIKVY